MQIKKEKDRGISMTLMEYLISRKLNIIAAILILLLIFPTSISAETLSLEEIYNLPGDYVFSHPTRSLNDILIASKADYVWWNKKVDIVKENVVLEGGYPQFSKMKNRDVQNKINKSIQYVVFKAHEFIYERDFSKSCICKLKANKYEI